MSKYNNPTVISENTLDRWQYRFSYLEGQILTIIDASISEKNQREAVKSLIRNTLFDNRRSLEMYVKNEKICDGGSTEPLKPFKE